MRRLIKNRKGTAEVIGTIMFIVILMFFFTNVYLWHDAATKDMNELYVKKMNAGMGIIFDGNQVNVTATGSDVTLSRLWIDTSSSHVYANLNVQVAPGAAKAVTFTFSQSSSYNSDGSVTVGSPQGNTIMVHYALQDPSVKFTIVNTLGIAVSS